jgi:mono/diheme cytochrome c family protein
MQGRGIVVGGCLLAAGIVTGALGADRALAQDKPAPGNPAGWSLPSDAAAKKNPHAVDDKLLAAGRAVYKDKCAKCHGPGGLGDGPDADPDHREDMDLTNAKRAERNSDGVVFYKVSNGRRRPKMPEFKKELSEDQIWQVVAYVQSLRKKP